MKINKINMDKLLMFWIVFLLTVNHSFSQDKDSILVVNFFKIYEEQDIKQSLEYVYSSNSWILDEATNTDTIANQLQNVVTQLGNYYGYELIKKAKLGNSYIAYSYLVKYDRQPLRFVFLLYKPKNEWRFQSFNFDGNIAEEMYNTTNISWDY